MGELATKIRAKYPGAYDALSDADLEAKVVAKYPGVYDHLAGPQQAQATLPQQEEPVPQWGEKHPNLYGLYGAGKAILDKTFIGKPLNQGQPLPSIYDMGQMPEPTAPEKIAMAKDVSGWALPVAKVGPESNVMANTAKTIYEKALKVPPSVKDTIRQTAIETGLNNSVPITKGGLNRTKDVLNGLLDDMDAAIANSPKQGNLIRIDDVLKPVEDLKDWVSKTADPKRFGIAKINNIIADFKKRYGNDITVAAAQEVKQATNQWLKKNAYGQLQNATTEAHKQIVRGLKDEIANAIPEISGINLKYGQMKQLESALERAVHRTGNWDWLHLSGVMLGAGVGAATGRVGSALEATALVRILKSPQVMSRLAIALNKGSKINGSTRKIVDDITNTAIRNLIQKRENSQGMSAMEQSVLTNQ